MTAFRWRGRSSPISGAATPSNDMLPHAVGRVKPQVSDLYTAVVLRWIAWSRRAHVTCGNGRYQIVMSDSRRRPRSASFASLNGKVASIDAVLARRIR